MAEQALSCVNNSRSKPDSRSVNELEMSSKYTEEFCFVSH